MFDKKKVSIDKLKEINESFEVVLSKEFVDYLKRCIDLNK